MKCIENMKTVFSVYWNELMPLPAISRSPLEDRA